MNSNSDIDIIDEPIERRLEIILSIDQQLLKDGRLQLHPYEFYEQFSNLHLRFWMQARGRYQLPTIELIDWLKQKIGDRFAIEVAAGNADIGWHLGIKQTDSWIQTNPMMQVYMHSRDSAPTTPKSDVEKLEASEAVEKYKPQVAVASWLTQKRLTKDPLNEGDGFFGGANELALIDRVESYIFIGNRSVHGQKRVLRVAHEEYTGKELGLVSRGRNPELNVIWIWNKKEAIGFGKRTK